MEDATLLSVHLASWPKANSLYNSIEPGFVELIELIPDIAKALEDMRTQGKIGSSFDAQIKILTKDEIRYKYLESLRHQIPEVFKVSSVEVLRSDDLDSGILAKRISQTAFVVEEAKGKKCVRCWNYEENVGESKNHPLICKRCLEALGE
jgi:isoleucyl-tRNA synthetase